MASPDPDFWKDLALYAVGALSLPVGYVWKKVNGSVQKEEFKAYAEAVKETIRDHTEQDEQMRRESRETFIKLFERLEKQGEVLNRVDATVTFLREKR